MPQIQVTGPILEILGPHQKSMLEAFIGCCMEADGVAVAKLHAFDPPRIPLKDCYAVALADALEALALTPNRSYRDAALLYWGSATIRPYCIYIPHTSAHIIEAT